VTTLWVRAFVDELARAGVREVVVSPGSRSTPLVLAFAQHGRFDVRVHLDERSGAFFALGLGKVSRRPAVMVTTSGTAAANAFPAVVEAAQSDTPLLVLTADRPHRLRGADANQTIRQTELYGNHARAFFDVPEPSAEVGALRHLRSLAARAVLSASEVPRGPVHMNLPFDKPLEPATYEELETLAEAHPLASAGREEGLPYVRTVCRRRRPTPEDVSLLSGLSRGAPRGVVVAGPTADPSDLGAAVLRFGATTGYPVIADPLSGARFRAGASATVVEAADLVLRDEDVIEALTPDLVIRVGSSPTSAAVQGWLEHHSGVRHVVIDDGSRWKDHGAVATDYIRCDPSELLATAAGDSSRVVDPEWHRLWTDADRSAVGVLTGVGEGVGDLHEGDILAAVAASVPTGATLFVSSSMPIRDLDAFGSCRDSVVHVVGNRGASGIDGIVSTAFGVAAASAGPTVCVLGDVALFHDLNGLLWSREEDLGVVFVLIDNDGGGIFHMLPVREHEPHFSRYFATPHGLDFSHAANMHGVPFFDVTGADLSNELKRAVEVGRTSILRVRTDRTFNERRHAELAESVARRVRASLEQTSALTNPTTDDR
jgi:2-succinyl-5-enolpyruvyl-6-hydroxy-3-cyclohexene-1-carboxylate synthase